MKWTAIVLAGSRPGGDPFATAMGCDLKPLIPVAGEPMVRRPIRALLANDRIGEIIVMAQAPERIAAALPADPRIEMRKSRAQIAETLFDLCADRATSWPLLVTTADHALLTPAMIDDFLTQAEGCDLAVAFVERRRLLARFPDSQRTWLGFQGGKYSGANLFGFGSPRVKSAIAKWRAVEEDRKKGWRVLAALGPTLFLGAVLKVRTIEQTAQSLGRKLGISIRAVQMTDATAAIDVDKLSDHRLVEAILESRE